MNQFDNEHNKKLELAREHHLGYPSVLVLLRGPHTVNRSASCPPADALMTVATWSDSELLPKK